MSTARDRNEAMTRKAQHLRDRAFELLEAAEALEKRPAEPTADGVAIVYFEKTFGKPDVEPYSYAALRITGGEWYTTSTRANSSFANWDALLDFVYQGEDPLNLPAIYLATELEVM